MGSNNLIELLEQPTIYIPTYNGLTVEICQKKLRLPHGHYIARCVTAVGDSLDAFKYELN